MRIILPGVTLFALLGCNRERAVPTARSTVPDSVLVQERRLGDSLVRAALAEDGARLEYRWVTRLDSVQPQGSRAVFDPASRRWLVLNDTVAMDLSQATGVAVHPGSAGSFVALQLSMTSGDRLISTTNRHLGSQWAVMLNGHLVIAPAPIVRTPLAGSLLVVQNVDSSVARELAGRLQAGLPRSGRP